MAYDVIFAHRNGGIGYKGALPWSIPADLEYFKKVTGDKGLVCAYDTYISLPEVVKKRVVCIQSSRFLPELKNVNVLGNINHKILEELSHYRGDLVVIGGTSLYTSDIVLNARHVHVTSITSGKFNIDRYLDATMMSKLKEKPYEIIDQKSRDFVNRVPAYTIRKYFAKLSTTNSNRTSDRII